MSVRGELAVDNVDSRVLVAGVLAVSSPAVCDRCLEAFTLAYEAGVDIQIIRAKSGTRDEESPDTWILYQARGEVDLDVPLREAALLDLPIKRVCREDCLGFCPACGADRNLKDCDCPREPADPLLGRAGFLNTGSEASRWLFPRKRRATCARAPAARTGTWPPRARRSARTAGRPAARTASAAPAATTACAK